MCHLRRLVQSDASGCRAVHEISLTRILSYASAFDRNYLPITPNMASNAASIVTDSRLVAATKARSGDALLTQLWPCFRGAIFIGPTNCAMSAFGGKADMPFCTANVRL